MDGFAGAELTALIHDQEADALDDGFPYEHLGERDQWFHGNSGWVTPTPFMITSLREMLDTLVRVYGYRGHWLVRDIGWKNLTSPSFLNQIGLDYFEELQRTVLRVLPEEERARWMAR